MNKTKIEWADYTWNPVVGCKRGCSYCYAKKMNDRFKWIPDFAELKFYPERLDEPSKLKKPTKIFVGSMTDICYWDLLHAGSIVNICRENPQHTFMFLSKSHDAYDDYDFPQNCKLGLTVTFKDPLDRFAVSNFKMFNENTKKFISIEPLLGTIYKTSSYIHPVIEKVIVGAMTGQGAIKPKPEWIQSIKDNIPEEKIFWKENIKPYL